MSEGCFQECVDNLNSHQLSSAEARCVDMCVGKRVALNHRLMSIYLEVQPEMVEKRMQAQEELVNKTNQALMQQQQTQTPSVTSSVSSGAVNSS